MNGTTERGDTQEISARIPGGPASAGKARELLTEIVGPRATTATMHDIHLLTTELITNAVRHADVDADTSLELRVGCAPQHVRVSVVDPGGTTSPRVQELDVNVPGGMGLFLVEQISDRWGVDRAGDGATCVWFEVAA